MLMKIKKTQRNHRGSTESFLAHRVKFETYVGNEDSG